MILSVAGIRFSYNSVPILRGVSFALDKGHILGVLGINGAGKSTLLKCINRVLKPKGGQVMLSGKDMSRMSRNEIARHLGYVPQKYSDEMLTVFDTVLLGRKPYIEWAATEQDLSVVERVIKLMNLEHLALRPANQLSGGEMQKVILARALAQEPAVLLLDEPTSNLDLKNQLQFMNLVTKAVREHGLSAIVCLHDINLAFRFVDHFLMLKDGTVHTLAPKERITSDIIQEVYGVEVILRRVRDHTVVIPVKETEREEP